MKDYIFGGSIITIALLLLVSFFRRKWYKNNPIRHHRSNLNEHDINAISILRNNYRFDLEEDLVEIPLHYQEAAEIVDQAASDSKNVLLTESFIEYLMEQFSLIPKKFNIDLRLTFDNYCGYTKETLIDAVQKKIEEHYNIVTERNKKQYFLALVYIIFCAAISILGSIPIRVDYAAGVETMYSLIIGLLVENIAVLVLWQAGSTLFDIWAQRKSDNVTHYRRLHSIGIVEGEKCVLLRDRNRIIRLWPYIKVRERITYALLIISNFYVLTICLVEVLSFITSNFSLNPLDRWLYSLEWICTAIITWSNFSFFFDRGKIARHSLQISFDFILILSVYNVARLLYERSHGIPFNSDNYLITYLMLAIVNTICIYIIRQERIKRIMLLLEERFSGKK